LFSRGTGFRYQGPLGPKFPWTSFPTVGSLLLSLGNPNYLDCVFFFFFSISLRDFRLCFRAFSRLAVRFSPPAPYTDQFRPWSSFLLAPFFSIMLPWVTPFSRVFFFFKGNGFFQWRFSPLLVEKAFSGAALGL